MANCITTLRLIIDQFFAAIFPPCIEQRAEQCAEHKEEEMITLTHSTAIQPEAEEHKSNINDEPEDNSLVYTQRIYDTQMLYIQNITLCLHKVQAYFKDNDTFTEPIKYLVYPDSIVFPLVFRQYVTASKADKDKMANAFSQMFEAFNLRFYHKDSKLAGVAGVEVSAGFDHHLLFLTFKNFIVYNSRFNKIEENVQCPRGSIVSRCNFYLE
jgi:hypothetical protein